MKEPRKPPPPKPPTKSEEKLDEELEEFFSRERSALQHADLRGWAATAAREASRAQKAASRRLIGTPLYATPSTG